MSKAWMEERQKATANVTYKIEGGEKIDEADLPSRFFNTPAATASEEPCTRQRAAVQKCLEAGQFHKCEPLLETFNKCEETYFTKQKVETIEQKMGGLR